LQSNKHNYNKETKSVTTKNNKNIINSNNIIRPSNAVNNKINKSPTNTKKKKNN